MHSSDSNNDVIQKGRKKVYSVKEKLELLLPNGNSDGVLELDDLIYVVQKLKINGQDAFRFRVMKFVDSKKEGTIYCAEEKHFKPYFEKKSNTDGETTNQNNNKKKNYIVPSILGLGGGVFGYMMAKKYQKNAVMFGLAGLVAGVTIGIFILSYKNKQK